MKHDQNLQTETRKSLALAEFGHENCGTEPAKLGFKHRELRLNQQKMWLCPRLKGETLGLHQTNSREFSHDVTMKHGSFNIDHQRMRISIPSNMVMWIVGPENGEVKHPNW